MHGLVAASNFLVRLRQTESHCDRSKRRLGAFKRRMRMMVPRRGLEPPRLAAHGPEPCASTNSATWARCAADVSGRQCHVNDPGARFGTVGRFARSGAERAE